MLNGLEFVSYLIEARRLTYLSNVTRPNDCTFLVSEIELGKSNHHGLLSLVAMPTTTATVGAITIETTTTTTAATTDYYITFQSAEVLVLRRFWLTTLKRLTTADYVLAHFVRCYNG